MIDFLFFVAEEARRLMARLGVRRFEDLVGRVDLLEPDDAIARWQARGIDLVERPARPRRAGRHAAAPHARSRYRRCRARSTTS